MAPEEAHMNSPTLLAAAEGAVMRLTLNRPDRLNSFNGELLAALRAGFAAADADPGCRVVLLTGAGRGFCAGQDLSESTVKPGDPAGDIGRTLEESYNPLIALMRALSKPIVVAVNGVAAGAGASIALHGDIVLAARSAKFIQAFAKIGLIPDAGGTWLLPRMLGEARARGLALLGDPLGAEQAESWGLIWKAVDDDKLMDEAMALARRLADGPTKAYIATRKALLAAETNSLEAQLALERRLQRDMGHTADFVEGVTAFSEKRAAKFTGR
jgi:2-(1,2-epoxy-1,2-dihydrophenyl)acetyl-CoA isomerase